MTTIFMTNTPRPPLGRILFGCIQSTTLPPNWMLISSPNDWLKIKSPEGKLYLITATHLIPYQRYDEATPIEGSGLKHDEWYCNDCEAIPWPEGLSLAWHEVST